MAFCGHCGKEAESGERFCAYCGSPLESDANIVPVSSEKQDNTTFTEKIKQTGESVIGVLFRYADTSYRYVEKDRNGTKTVAMLSYLHILVLVPLLSMRESPFTQYHVRVGLNLLLAELIAEIGGAALIHLLGDIFLLGFLVKAIVWIANICLAAVAVFGIVSTLKGKAREFQIFIPFKLFR